MAVSWQQPRVKDPLMPPLLRPACVCLHTGLCYAGGFTVADIHSWLGGVLPGIPQHLTSSSSSSSGYQYLLFKQQETGTLLGCTYTQGQATFLW
jgi:hypothetical protein